MVRSFSLWHTMQIMLYISWYKQRERNICKVRCDTHQYCEVIVHQPSTPSTTEGTLRSNWYWFSRYSRCSTFHYLRIELWQSTNVPDIALSCIYSRSTHRDYYIELIFALWYPFSRCEPIFKMSLF